jgi:hypothetical protein
MNYYRGSFLDEGFDKHMKEKWRLDGFDIVAGNPPFNKSLNNRSNGGSSIWDKFVINVLQILKSGGYLVFIHPSSWRKPENQYSLIKDVYRKLINNQIHYLKINGNKEGFNVFKVGTRFDYYFLEKTDVYKKTIIDDEENILNELFIQEWPFLPNCNFDFFKQLLVSSVDEKNCQVFNNSSYHSIRKYVSKTKDNIYKYPLIHSTPKSGIRYMYSSRNDKGHFGVSKVIFGESGINHVIIDIEGKYGMTQGSISIEVDNITDAKQIKKVLLSDNFKIILKSTSWGNYRIDWKMFKYFKNDWWKYV